MRERTQNERWLPVPGFEGAYEVSDHGRVRSLTRQVTSVNGQSYIIRGRVRKLATDHNGHLALDLQFEGRRGRFYVQRLVLQAFVGPCPDGMEACHWDGDPTNNHVDNLRWDTRSANVLDMARVNTHNNARKTHCKRGHAFTPENTGIHPRGGRQCRACARIRMEQFLARRGACA